MADILRIAQTCKLALEGVDDSVTYKVLGDMRAQVASVFCKYDSLSKGMVGEHFQALQASHDRTKEFMNTNASIVEWTSQSTPSMSTEKAQQLAATSLSKLDPKNILNMAKRLNEDPTARPSTLNPFEPMTIRMSKVGKGIPKDGFGTPSHRTHFVGWSAPHHNPPRTSRSTRARPTPSNWRTTLSSRTTSGRWCPTSKSWG